ncbi:general secretion pathway protein GspB [Roseateles sp. NT4]|uniref:general secretion pathway protein GspB n=1 Tax=Roseateles sp. NT4 TaxID=3453715 RepID=UPI003EEE90AD
MSYILDALRRAEADRERERGQVPGLHTQPQPVDDARGAAQRRWLPWAGAGLLLLAGIGAGSWWASGQRDAAAQLPSLPPAPAPQIAAAPAPAPAPAASAVLPQPAASTSPYLPPAPPPVAMAPATAPVVAAKPAATPAPAAEAPIPRLAELPESTRRELPKLAISGSVYSDNPASRFVMINGEVMREGATLGPDLVLEQIGPRELVLRFKGQRFRQPV